MTSREADGGGTAAGVALRPRLCTVGVNFWKAVFDAKLHVWKTETPLVPVAGAWLPEARLHIESLQAPQSSQRVASTDAPDGDQNVAPSAFSSPGTIQGILKNFNSQAEFDACKSDVFRPTDGAAVDFARSAFLIEAYADLKGFHVNYRVGIFQSSDKSDPEQCNKFAIKWLENSGGHTFTVNLARHLNPQLVQAAAIDLHISLIKWRILRDLDDTALKNKRVLFFGIGALGCAIARNLIGWGVSKFTFVDNGTVEFACPARQSLFTHSDAVHSELKVFAARKRLLEIRPDADVLAIPLELPILGDFDRWTSEQISAIVKLLRLLISSHDFVLMLTDTRESRWLPSVLLSSWSQWTESCSFDSKSLETVFPKVRASGGGYNCSISPNSEALDTTAEGLSLVEQCEKLVAIARCRREPPLGITTALGFDTYVVLRHSPACRGACYFCNDLSSPVGSSVFHTLDNRCTVTRPGVTSIAAGMTAELIAALAQVRGTAGDLSPPSAVSAAETVGGENIDAPTSCLGPLPSSIRGDIQSLALHALQTERFEHCICCSEPVKQAVQSGAEEFLYEALGDPDVLERLSGLERMKQCTNFDDVVALS